MDRTREAGLILQGGVKDAQFYQWGPFKFINYELAGTRSYAIALNFYFFDLNIGITFAI